MPITKDDVTAIKAAFSSSSFSAISTGASNTSAGAGTAADSFVGIKLLGFLPQRLLSKDLNLVEPYFLFPNEKAVSGSKTLRRS